MSQDKDLESFKKVRKAALDDDDPFMVYQRLEGFNILAGIEGKRSELVEKAKDLHDEIFVCGKEDLGSDYNDKNPSVEDERKMIEDHFLDLVRKELDVIETDEYKEKNKIQVGRAVDEGRELKLLYQVKARMMDLPDLWSTYKNLADNKDENLEKGLEFMERDLQDLHGRLVDVVYDESSKAYI